MQIAKWTSIAVAGEEVLLFAAAHTTELHARSLLSSDRGLVQSQKAHGERHVATVPP